MIAIDLKLRQLDDALGSLGAHVIPPVPRGGWIKAIRTAIGLTTRQFASRLGLAQPTVVAAEHSEAAGTMTLGQLRRLAAALDCELHYVLIPSIPLAARVEAQAERKARERIGSIAHTMALEAQRAGSDFEQRQIDAMKSELRRGRRSRLWD